MSGLSIMMRLVVIMLVEIRRVLGLPFKSILNLKRNKPCVILKKLLSKIINIRLHNLAVVRGYASEKVAKVMLPALAAAYKEGSAEPSLGDLLRQ